jgi:hypothetical protein
MEVRSLEGIRWVGKTRAKMSGRVKEIRLTIRMVAVDREVKEEPRIEAYWIS